MSIFILVTGVCAIFCLLLKKVLRKKGKNCIQWGLGVDNCCFYSRPFSVTNQDITISGFQDVVDQTGAIRYSLVRMTGWGKRKVYGYCLIHGVYKDTNSFQITIKNVPNGDDYQIEVFNGFNLSYGRFQVKQ